MTDRISLPGHNSYNRLSKPVVKCVISLVLSSWIRERFKMFGWDGLTFEQSWLMLAWQTIIQRVNTLHSSWSEISNTLDWWLYLCLCVCDWKLFDLIHTFLWPAAWDSVFWNILWWVKFSAPVSSPDGCKCVRYQVANVLTTWIQLLHKCCM